MKEKGRKWKDEEKSSRCKKNTKEAKIKAKNNA
jgi:hypothetical protein